MKRLEEWLNSNGTRTVSHWDTDVTGENLFYAILKEGGKSLSFESAPTLEAAINAALDAAEGKGK